MKCLSALPVPGVDSFAEVRVNGIPLAAVAVPGFGGFLCLGGLAAGGQGLFPELGGLLQLPDRHAVGFGGGLVLAVAAALEDGPDLPQEGFHGLHQLPGRTGVFFGQAAEQSGVLRHGLGKVRRRLVQGRFLAQLHPGLGVALLIRCREPFRPFFAAQDPGRVVPVGRVFPGGQVLHPVGDLVLGHGHGALLAPGADHDAPQLPVVPAVHPCPRVRPDVDRRVQCLAQVVQAPGRHRVQLLRRPRPHQARRPAALRLVELAVVLSGHVSGQLLGRGQALDQGGLYALRPLPGLPRFIQHGEPAEVVRRVRPLLIGSAQRLPPVFSQVSPGLGQPVLGSRLLSGLVSLPVGRQLLRRRPAGLGCGLGRLSRLRGRLPWCRLLGHPFLRRPPQCLFSRRRRRRCAPVRARQRLCLRPALFGGKGLLPGAGPPAHGLTRHAAQAAQNRPDHPVVQPVGHVLLFVVLQGGLSVVDRPDRRVHRVGNHFFQALRAGRCNEAGRLRVLRHPVQGVHQHLVQALAAHLYPAAKGFAERGRHGKEFLRDQLRPRRSQAIQALLSIAGPGLPCLVRPAAKGTGAHRRQAAHAAGHGAQGHLRHHLCPEGPHVYGHVAQFPDAEFSRRQIFAALSQQLVRPAVHLAGRLFQRFRVCPVSGQSVPVVPAVLRRRQEPARRLRQAAQRVLPGPAQRQAHAGECAPPQVRVSRFQVLYRLVGPRQRLPLVLLSAPAAASVIQRLLLQQRCRVGVGLLCLRCFFRVPGPRRVPQLLGFRSRCLHARLVSRALGIVIQELVAAQLLLSLVAQIAVPSGQLRQGDVPAAVPAAVPLPIALELRRLVGVVLQDLPGLALPPFLQLLAPVP